MYIPDLSLRARLIIKRFSIISRFSNVIIGFMDNLFKKFFNLSDVNPLSSGGSIKLELLLKNRHVTTKNPFLRIYLFFPITINKNKRLNK
jgi:hypothetical protein